MLLLLQAFLEIHFLNNTRRSVTFSWFIRCPEIFFRSKSILILKKPRVIGRYVWWIGGCSCPTNMSFPPPRSAREGTLVQPERCHNESKNCWKISPPFLSNKPARLFSFCLDKKDRALLTFLIGVCSPTNDCNFQYLPLFPGPLCNFVSFSDAFFPCIS